MEGSLLLDPEHQRLAEITGQLTSGVKFGWGLLGHLDQGGTFFVRQQDLGSGRWELAELNVQMRGKALLFKTISVRQHQVFSDFRPAPARGRLWSFCARIPSSGESSIVASSSAEEIISM